VVEVNLDSLPPDSHSHLALNGGLFLLPEGIRPSIPPAVPPSLFFILTVQCTEERA
jgi:hypothetical protein